MAIHDPDRPKSVALIVNPTAGRDRAGRALPRIREALQRRGVNAQYLFTRARGDGEALARQAIAAGTELIVAVGGDGTLHEVTNAVMDANSAHVTLGLIPFGTGNDFARAVGLFDNLQVACDAITDGRRAHVDIGYIEGTGFKDDAGKAVTGRWFLVAAGLGYVADTAKTVNEGIRFLHGAPAYLYGAAQTLRTMEPFRIEILVNGSKLEITEATLVSVSNVETTGGGLKIAPGAVVDDGMLDVCIVGPISRMGLLKQLPHVVNGTHVRHPLVQMVQAARVEIATVEPKHLWIDGEISGTTPASFEIRPGALPIMLPSKANV